VATDPVTAAELADEIRGAQTRAGGRVIVGFAGPPGCGKSTLTEAVCAELDGRAVSVPLDGWHLSAELTRRLGAAERRGAPQTFDASGYVALLERIRAQGATGDPVVVYAPEYRREIEEPVAGAVAVHARTPIVLTEGNYLLLDQPVWRDVRPLLDLAYYVEIDDEERRRRLVGRHVAFGRTSEDAVAWMETNDDLNARLVETERLRPDRIVRGP
jgi:pantothenate kinase